MVAKAGQDGPKPAQTIELGDALFVLGGILEKPAARVSVKIRMQEGGLMMDGSGHEVIRNLDGVEIIWSSVGHPLDFGNRQGRKNVAFLV